MILNGERSAYESGTLTRRPTRTAICLHHWDEIDEAAEREGRALMWIANYSAKRRYTNPRTDVRKWDLDVKCEKYWSQGRGTQ